MRRTGTVVEPGEYAVRGGLLDVFPTADKHPLRLDFFGSTVETIRTFDPLTQRSLQRMDRLEIGPVSEVVFDQEAIERFKVGYLQNFGAVSGDPLFDAVREGRSYPGMEHWLPLFHERLATLFDYLDEAAEVAFDHLARDGVAARAVLIGEHYEARKVTPPAGSSFGTAPYRPLSPHLLYLDEQSFAQEVERRASFEFSIFGPPPRPPTGVDAVIDLEGRPSRDFAHERADRSINLFDAIVAHLRALLGDGARPLVTASSEGALERLKQVLEDHGQETFTRIRHARGARGIGWRRPGRAAARPWARRTGAQRPDRAGPPGRSSDPGRAQEPTGGQVHRRSLGPQRG